MESNRLNYLKRQYWNGNTTPEEEAELKRYYQQHKDAEHPEMAAYFQSLAAFGELRPTATFDLDALETTGREAPVFTLKFLRNVAAVLLLAIGVGVVWNTSRQPVATEAVYTDAEIEQSYQEARQALLLIAAKLEKGKRTLEELEHFDAAKEKIKK